MKAVYLLALFLLSTIFLSAQQPASQNTIAPGKGNPKKQLKQIKQKKIDLHSDSTNEPRKSDSLDSTIQNKYGDLLHDDSIYNKKYPIWIPAVEVLAANALVWSADRYILNADFAHINFTTWTNNINKGWEWDKDRFGINFIGHPYSGTLSFNTARSNGYNYFQSFAFAVGGSVMWEYFGENTQPSFNDAINTPINGAFLGEILYRLSSNLLDDRTRGWERFSRELGAGLINPVRGLNRVLQGKSFRKTTKEVYQKEPLNISLYGGLHYINDGKGPTQMINIQFDYGNPFEKRFRKPFDFFKLRTDLNFGVGRKHLDYITGYGILFGKNKEAGKTSLLFGGFQYFDYWDNKTFELGTIGFGPGLFSKLPVGKTSDLYMNAHLAAVPFAGNSKLSGPDSSQVRDYNYGGGLEAKFETTFNLGKYASASLVYYYYMIHTYVGTPGNNFVNIIKPRITARIYKDVSLGFEHFIYSDDRYLTNSPATHAIRTEQKIFLLLYLEDRQRKGRYN